MKTLKSPSGIVSVLLALVVLVPFGCAKSTGIQRQEKTTATMGQVENDMNAVTRQIDATNLALNDVVEKGQSPNAHPEDVKKTFNTYSDNVKKMDQVAKTFSNHSDQMSAQGNAYFEEWRKEGNTYVNPNIQTLSEDRRVQLRKTFTNIASSSVNMRASLNAYLSDIKQIQTYLSNDLTAAGITAVAPIAQTAQADGNKVKSEADPVRSAIEQARAEMTPGGGAAAGGAGAQGTAPAGTGTAPY